MEEYFGDNDVQSPSRLN